MYISQRREQLGVFVTLVKELRIGDRIILQVRIYYIG